MIDGLYRRACRMFSCDCRFWYLVTQKVVGDYALVDVGLFEGVIRKFCHIRFFAVGFLAAWDKRGAFVWACLVFSTRMDEATRQHLFEPFFTTKEPTGARVCRLFTPLFAITTDRSLWRANRVWGRRSG